MITCHAFRAKTTLAKDPSERWLPEIESRELGRPGECQKVRKYGLNACLTVFNGRYPKCDAKRDREERDREWSSPATF